MERPDLSFEIALWGKGLWALAGLDEAGRGAWAGPVSAGVVILPHDESILGRWLGVRDSKLMTPRQRSYWAARIREEALAWGVGLADNREIDAWGIVPATRLAMARALQQLQIAPQHLLLDALRLPEVDIPQTALIKGDRKVLSIAAASVLAKTTRDEMMCQMEAVYPGYGFARHKGYGTRQHQEALARLGLSDFHRHSFQFSR
ncbi:MAG TPA: ribonuclease HII [Anaerolineaceae bacterium]|nr:ribonuclease HII [Anaerolineaceae bacterium]